MANALAALGVGGRRPRRAAVQQRRPLPRDALRRRCGSARWRCRSTSAWATRRSATSSEDSEAAVLVASAALAERGPMLARADPGDQARDRRRARGRRRAGLRDACWPPPRPRWPGAPPPPTRSCMQPYTSGSTGKPKGVLLTHGGQVWNADILRKALLCRRHRARAHRGAALPQERDGGRGEAVPARGRLARDPARLRRARGHPRHRPLQVTYLTGVPAMYKMILAEKDALGRARRLQRALRGVRLGRGARGAARRVPARLRRADRRELRAHRGRPGADREHALGAQEAQPLRPRVPGLRRPAGRRGRAARWACDEVGELVTRNPGLAKGYWKLPEATAKKFRDGWLYTGDLMRRDADGYYYFVGRRDDMINVAGENVYPKEVEDILLQHPNLRDACVVPGAPRREGRGADRLRRGARGRDDHRGRRAGASSWSAAPPTRTRAGSCSWTRCRSAAPARSTARRLKARAQEIAP